MGRSLDELSIGGSNGNADELTNWDGTKKKMFGKILVYIYSFKIPDD